MRSLPTYTGSRTKADSQGKCNQEETRRENRRRVMLIYAALGVALALLCLLSAGVGSASLSPLDVWRILLGDPSDEAGYQIVHMIRLPRILEAALLGGALSVSGFLLQTFFNNPIAGPFVLGISSGAKLTVAAAMVLALRAGTTPGSAGMILAAFIGSMLSMGFVLAVSRNVQRMSVLVICGIMIGYICSAVTDFIVTFADDSNIVNLHSWSLGSFSGASWENVRVIAAVAGAAMICSFLLSKPMGAYQLGEGYAQNLGVKLPLLRTELIVLSSVLSACVTAFAGPVSFVGVAVPHLVKRMLGTARPLLVLPGCFLGGAVFCVSCDLLARTLFAPTEVSISSVTAVFGAPVVIYMMLRRQPY